MNYTNLTNTDAERYVISACLTNQNTFYGLSDILKEELFSDYDCRTAYGVLQSLKKEGKTIDLTTAAPYLVKANVNIGRMLVDSTMSGDVARQHAIELYDLSIRRRFNEVCYKGQTMVGDPTLRTEDLQALTKELNSIIAGSDDGGIITFEQAMAQVTNDVVGRKNGEDSCGMLTGLHIFDSRYGFHGGDLVIMAGRTSAGKSTLATSICYNMACNGIPCVFYTLEMSAAQLTSRIMSSHIKIASSRILYDKLSDDEYNRYYDGTRRLAHLPIFFDEKNKSSFPKIKASIRRLVAQKGIKIVFIDYLQILANGKEENREQLLGDMCRDLKNLAEEFGICIVALSQLSRPKDGKDDTGNLRGSGQIEEAADKCVFISRPDKDVTRAKLKLKKNRNGSIGEEYVKFHPEYSFFSDYEQGDPQAPYQEKDKPLPF
ncbi:MAG: AAA family ATPase [Alistipes sp.]|nr:AAA family ATPase [Alistipes sp.]